MSDKLLYNLRVKCAPMVTPEGDRRYWYADHYGFSDDFGTPIADATNGPYGPPPLQLDGQAATERYAGSLIGTVARLQGYDPAASIWRRVIVDSAGSVSITAPGTLNVNVQNVPLVDVTTPAGFYVQAQVAVSNVTSTLVAAAVTTRTYLRVEAVTGNLWVMINLAAVAGQGILVTPTNPLVIEGVIAPELSINAIATAPATFANITQRRLP